MGSGRSPGRRRRSNTGLCPFEGCAALTLNPDRRARLHLRTAQALERTPQSDEVTAQLATHYRLAGRFGAPEHSINYAVRAGDVAQAAFAFEDAITHWQAALELMIAHAVEPGRQAALLEKLGDQVFLMPAGDHRGAAYHEQALKLFEQVGDRDATARIHFQIAVRFAQTQLEDQDLSRALRHARAAAAAVPLDEVSPRRVRTETLQAMTCYYRLQITDALAASRRAMDIVAGLNDDFVQCIVECHRGFCLAGAGHLANSRAMLAQAYALANRMNHPYLGASCAIWQGELDLYLLDPVEARRCFENELTQSRIAQAKVPRQNLSFSNTRARLMMGDVVEVLPELPPGGLYQSFLEAARAYLAGDWLVCRDAATRALDLSRRRGNAKFGFQALHQLAQVARAEDDGAVAADLLGRALEAVTCQHRPFEARAAADLAAVYAGLSRTDDARAALSQCRASLSQDEDWRGLGGRLLLADALVAAAEEDTALAHEQFARARTIFRRYQLPWDEAQALECWGDMSIRSGDRKAGDQRLDAAATIYRRHQAGRRWLQRVATIRAAARQRYALPSKPVVSRALSHREVEVLSLVADGLSNEEIAKALVLSVRTVERHLGNMYEKLGARGKSARAVATGYAIASGLVAGPGT